MELTERRQRILRRIVEEYVTTALPVASELIARKYEPDVSSATVRNEMAALEELGLIAQPHTSAGRVPTDQGYRLFVERLMQQDSALPLSEQRTMRHQFQQGSGTPADSAALASTVLARTLRSAAVASAPAVARAQLRRLELVPLQEDVVLVTLILQSGAVRQKVQRLAEPLSREELTQLSNELSDVLGSKPWGEIRRTILTLEPRARQFADVVIELLKQAEEQAFTAVTCEGLAQLLDQPEFAHSEKLRPILEVLEQQPLLARFIAESLAHPGVQVIIGSENRLAQMREATVILTRYGNADDVGGVVGVVGPTRFPYWRAVPTVRFMAELMEMLVQDAYGQGTARPAAEGAESRAR